MRAVRLSITFNDQLNELIAQGEDQFGIAVAEVKKQKVYSTIRSHLAHHPRTKKPHSRLGLVVYPVTDTPFVVLYDFDDAELRIHFVFHRHADLRDLDPKSVGW
jgi:plasmid stabilization system protein ParE